MRLSKLFFPTLMGNVLEWFDFILLIYFIDEIAILFFPISTNHVAGLLKASGLFALGFIGRPLGSLLLGYYADQFGRKKILLFSTGILALSTTLIGLLPTYSQLGITATIMLIAIRFIQGFCISGELNTATAFLIEHTENKQHGFAGSLLIASSSLGICLAAIFSFMLHHYLNHTSLLTFGWRIPFLIGGLLGVITFLLRWRLPESPVFLHSQPQSLRIHFNNAWQYRKTILPILLMISAPAVSNYFLSGYFNVFLKQQNIIHENTILLISFLTNAFTLLCYPLTGYISDRIGKIRCMKISSIITALCSVLIFAGLQQSLFSVVLTTQCLFAVITAPLTSLTTVIIAESLPISIRTTITNFSYNTGMLIFGGTATFISLWLTNVTHSWYAPSIYLMGISLLSWWMLQNKVFNKLL